MFDIAQYRSSASNHGEAFSSLYAFSFCVVLCSLLQQMIGRAVFFRLRKILIRRYLIRVLV